MPQEQQEFYIGQVFTEVYPPEAAEWCNKNNAYIEAKDDGSYIIVTVPEPTQEELDAARVIEIDAELATLDAQEIRHSVWLSLALSKGTTDAVAVQKLEDIEAQKEVLRIERNTLTGV